MAPARPTGRTRQAVACRRWIATLDRLAAFDFEQLVPGHGAIQKDTSYIRRLQALLAEVRRQVAVSVAEGRVYLERTAKVANRF